MLFVRVHLAAREILIVLAQASSPQTETGSRMQRIFTKGSHVFRQGERAEFFYKIISGTLCTYRFANNGRRQINAFCVAGDIVGLDTCDEHRLSAVVMSDATVIVFQRRHLDMNPVSEATLSEKEIISSLMRSLERAENHAFLLSGDSPRERVSAFLVDFSERALKSNAFKLRQTDIADYVGLSRETVSRVLGRLAHREARPRKKRVPRANVRGVVTTEAAAQ